MVWIQEKTEVISLLLFLSVSFRDLACNKFAYASVVLTNVYKLLEEQSVTSTTWHGLGRKDELLTSYRQFFNAAVCLHFAVSPASTEWFH